MIIIPSFYIYIHPLILRRDTSAGQLNYEQKLKPTIEWRLGERCLSSQTLYADRFLHWAGVVFGESAVDAPPKRLVVRLLGNIFNIKINEERMVS